MTDRDKPPPARARPNRSRELKVDETTREDVIAAFKGSPVSLVREELVVAVPYDGEMNAALKALHGRFNGKTKKWHIPVAFHTGLRVLLPRIEEMTRGTWRDAINARQREAEEDIAIWMPAAEIAQAGLQVGSTLNRKGIFYLVTYIGRVQDTEHFGTNVARVWLSTDLNDEATSVTFRETFGEAE